MDLRPRDGRLGLRSLVLLALVPAMATATASCAGGSGGTTGSGGSTSTGTGGTTSSGGTTGTGGSNTGTGGATSGTGGTNTGTGGVTGSGGNTGSGGAAGSGGSSTGGATGSAGTTGSAGSGGCPPNFTFCSGFETPGLPAGAVYMVNAGPGDWSRDFAIDTTQHHAGDSSLLVKKSGSSGTSGSSYEMLAVPVPTGAFWVRFWVESDMPMGGTNPHNAFAGTSTSATPNDPLDSFAEDVGIAFHTLDSDVTWPTGYGRLPNSGNTNPYTLPMMTWACVEISYDLANRHQQLYINGTLLIDATTYPPAASYSGTFSSFKFGLDAFNGPARQMWYDDVAVAPTRIGGCQ